MSKKKTNDFLIQGSILAIAGIIARIIGIIYRIPLNNILGDEGLGYYSAAYDVYSIMLLISSMSMPLAVSKLISTANSKKHYKDSVRFLIGSLIISGILGLVVSTFTFFESGFLARLIGFPPAAYAMKALAPALLIMSILGVFRGFFQGLGNMIPTAFSQVLEQIANAIVSIVAASRLFDIGKKVDEAQSTTSTAYAYGAAGGNLGTLAGSLLALALMIFVFVLYTSVLKKKIKRDRRIEVVSYQEVGKMVIITIIPVLLSTTIYNFSNLIDSAIYGNIMNFLGVSVQEKSSVWGVYSGKYRMLTTVPIAFASSLSSSIIPSMISSITTGQRQEAVEKIRSAISFTMIIAMPCGVGLTALGSPIIMMLFPGTDMSIASVLMKFSLFTTLAYSLSTITNSVLQGMDRMKLPVIHASISLGIHVILLPLILIVFKANIYGVIIADILFAVVICILNQRSLKKHIGYHQEIIRTFLLPLIASVIMGIVAWLAYLLFHLITKSNAFSCLIAIVVAVVVYFIAIIMLHIVDEQTLYKFPKGGLLVRLAKKFHLL